MLKRIGSVDYKLQLPSEAHIHLIFHVSLMKRCISDPVYQFMPLPLLTSEFGPLLLPCDIFDVPQMLYVDGFHTELLVAWDGPTNLSLESFSHFQEC